MTTFVLNDEKQINSYGFRVLNNGINLTRFKANPVMLAQHSNTLTDVIGRWTNIRFSGDQLLADAQFDLADDQARKIADKVDRDFIRACSMGLGIQRENFKIDYNGELNLAISELMEASICAVPSNASAIRLFSPSGEPINENQLKLSLADMKANYTINHPQAYISNAQANPAHIRTMDDFEKLSLQEQLAFKNNHYSDYLTLFTTDKKTLERQLMQIGQAQVSPANIRTMDDFQKLSLQEQLAFKNDHNSAYKALFARQ